MENRLVAVMNKKVEPGRILNALAHLCVGFGAHLGPEALELMDYVDADENVHPNISKMPFIVLRASNGQLRQLRLAAQDNGVQFSSFTDSMTVGGWEEQLDRTRSTREEDLNYFGVVLFGPSDVVKELTKKFSLWK